MSESTTLFAGLDVRKDSIDIAVSEAARASEMRHLATVAGGYQPLPVAQALGVPKQTQYDKLRRLHISTDKFRQEA